MTITAYELAATVLDATSARELTTRLQGLLSEARDLLVAAYEGQAWKVLGYPTWKAYVAAELAGFSLPPEMVETTARELRARGWSLRAIGEPLRVSEFKVRTMTKDIAIEGEIIAASGKSYRADINQRPAAPAIEAAPVVDMPELPKTDTAVLDLLAAGADGLTGPEWGAMHGWGHSITSPTLSRLAAKGRVVRLAERRGVDAIYVHPEHALERPALEQRQRLALPRGEQLAITAG